MSNKIYVPVKQCKAETTYVIEIFGNRDYVKPIDLNIKELCKYSPEFKDEVITLIINAFNTGEGDIVAYINKLNL